MITTIKETLDENYWSPVEKEMYLEALTNITITLLRANSKVLEARKDNEHSGTFWSFISHFKRTDGMDQSAPIFEGASFLDKENSSFKNVVQTVIAVLSVGFFDRTGNIITNPDRVKMLEEAEASRGQIKRDLHRFLEHLSKLIAIKKRNGNLSASQELLGTQ